MTRTLMMIVHSVLEGAVAMMCFAIRLASDSRMAAQMVDLDGDGMLSFPDIIRVISISSRGEEVDRLTCMHAAKAVVKCNADVVAHGSLQWSFVSSIGTIPAGCRATRRCRRQCVCSTRCGLGLCGRKLSRSDACCMRRSVSLPGTALMQPHRKNGWTSGSR
jgi:hypothetical protein